MQTRRETIKQTMVVSGLLASTGLFPQYAHAAFNKAAFEAKTLADVMKALGASAPVESKDVSITAPDIAENGAVGFKMVKEFKPDIVLMDLMMPVQDGPETLDQFKAEGVKVPVVVLTNLGKEEAMKRIRTPDLIVDFLIKADCTPKQVVEKIQTILQKVAA